VWGVRRCHGSTGSSCSHPMQQCRPAPAPWGLWAERTAAPWAVLKRSGSGSTGGNWGLKLSVRLLLGLKNTQNTDKWSEGPKELHIVQFIELEKHCREIGNKFFKCSCKICGEGALQDMFIPPFLLWFYGFIPSHRSSSSYCYISAPLLVCCQYYP